MGCFYTLSEFGDISDIGLKLSVVYLMSVYVCYLKYNISEIQTLATMLYFGYKTFIGPFRIS